MVFTNCMGFVLEWLYTPSKPGDVYLVYFDIVLLFPEALERSPVLSSALDLSSVSPMWAVEDMGFEPQIRKAVKEVKDDGHPPGAGLFLFTKGGWNMMGPLGVAGRLMLGSGGSDFHRFACEGFRKICVLLGVLVVVWRTAMHTAHVYHD